MSLALMELLYNPRKTITVDAAGAATGAMALAVVGEVGTGATAAAEELAVPAVISAVILGT